MSEVVRPVVCTMPLRVPLAGIVITCANCHTVLDGPSTCDCGQTRVSEDSDGMAQVEYIEVDDAGI